MELLSFFKKSLILESAVSLSDGFDGLVVSSQSVADSSFCFSFLYISDWACLSKSGVFLILSFVQPSIFVARSLTSSNVFSLSTKFTNSFSSLSKEMFNFLEDLKYRLILSIII